MKNLLLVLFTLNCFSAFAQPWKMPARQVSLQVSNAVTTVQEAFDSGALGGGGSVLFDPTSWTSLLQAVNTNYVNPFVFYMPGTNIATATYSNGVWTLPSSILGTNIVGATKVNNQWFLPDYRPIQVQGTNYVTAARTTDYVFASFQVDPSQSTYALSDGMSPSTGIFTTPFAGVYDFRFRVAVDVRDIASSNDNFAVFQRFVYPGSPPTTDTVSVLTFVGAISTATITNTHIGVASDLVYLPADTQVSYLYRRANYAYTNTPATAYWSIHYHGPGTAF
jgi:hypothetical protein